jgi:flagellar hook assembly protein FlgD
LTDRASRTSRLAAAVFALLLLATFGAFFLASRLKAEPAVLADLQRLRYFSPNGDGHRDVQPIRFRVNLDDAAAVDIVDRDGARVRRVASRLEIRRDRINRVFWNGRDDDGRRAPDGVYRMRLILADEGRSILAGKSFTLDTEPPSPAVVVDKDTPIVAPGAGVDFRVRGTGRAARPRFTVLRTDGDEPVAVREWLGRRGRHSFTWAGRDDAGKPVGPGTYLIAVSARDRAGNEGEGPPLPPSPSSVEGRPGVTVRALAVQPPVRPVRAGQLVAFRVDARGRSYRWQVRRLGTGRAAAASRRPKHGTTVLLRAPEGPSGVYLLEVTSRGARTAVPFAVQGDQPANAGRPLVVLPVVTWLGLDPVDDASPHDGLPDRFPASGVGYPRLYGYGGGLPAGFADDLAPLLVWLDRNHVRYDLTTDVALALDASELTPERRKGALFAGTPAWVGRGLARRLRGYVHDGGRIALFGPGALSAGVSVGDHRLSRPTRPSAIDAFGARFGEVRDVEPDVTGAARPLTVLQDDVDLGLLEGFSGELGGFEQLEPLLEPGGDGKVVVRVADALTDQEAADAEAQNKTPRPERTAFSATEYGKGLVIRIGLPTWVRRLAAGDAQVAQLTRNVVDVVHGVQPQPRSAG